ncbi:MAG: hypothetical protein RLZZ303_1611, partial [Candidatus Hydrogenedentota bacterium]
FLLGVALTQSLPGAILLCGWGQATMRRAVLAQWMRDLGHDPTEGLPRWPGFIVAEPGAIDQQLRLRRLRWLLGSAWSNLITGLRVLVATYIVTLPGVALMAFSWRYGWDNSFNKGYEQAYLGPTLGISGLFLLILAMLYVPLAQAQLSIGERLSTFFRWRVIWAGIRSQPHRMLWLAAVYFIASFPINVFLAAVLFRFNEAERIADLTDEEFLRLLRQYFWLVGLVGFPLFVWTRVVAARTYARCVESALRGGRIPAERLAGIAPLERFSRALSPSPQGGVVVKAIRRGSLVPVLALSLVLWFGFVAQIYVRQFLNYVPLYGWMNQPLVHAPWLRYIPDHLENAASERGVHETPDLPPY